jgi:hypothetical protein
MYNTCPVPVNRARLNFDRLGRLPPNVTGLASQLFLDREKSMLLPR